MSDDKNKDQSKKHDVSDEMTTAERSRISEIFDDNEDDKTVVEDTKKKIPSISEASSKVEEVVEAAEVETTEKVAAVAAVAATAKEKVEDVVEDAKDVVEDVVDGAKDAVEDVVDGAKDAVESAKDVVEDVIDDAKDVVEDVVDDAKGAVAGVVGKIKDIATGISGGDAQIPNSDDSVGEDGEKEVKGIAAFFNHPDHLMYAAEQANAADYKIYDAYSPFPIHGMDDAMGLERSWLPWVTFGAGAAGFSTAFGLQFGIMGFDWPMVFGGRPFIAWPSFVPILFELTVLFAGVTTAIVMLIAAGCFRKPFIIDKDITNDQFVLWISAEDKSFDIDDVIAFMKTLNPHTIRAIREGQK